MRQDKAPSIVAALSVLALSICAIRASGASEQAAPLFCFAHVSDTHCMFTKDQDKAHDFGGRIYSRSLDIFAGGLTYLEDDVKPAFLIHTGDIVENGGWESGRETMQKAKDMTSGKSFPFFPVFGNHDNSARKFEQVFGLGNYTFTYGTTMFIVLQCLNEFPTLSLRSLHVPKDVLYQLDDLLTKWRGNVVISMHEPLRCHEDEERWARVANHDLIIKILERHGNVAMVLQGHTHLYYRKRVNGIEYVTAPGLVNINKQADKALGHPMLVYNVYPDRIECRLHGAPSTDAAAKGAFIASKDVSFTVSLPRKAALHGKYKEGLRPRRLPNALARYDAAIEAGFNPIAFYLFRGWRFRTDPEDRGKELGWLKENADVSAWKPVKLVYLRNPWETYLARNYDGFAWYRITFTVPEALRGKELQFIPGQIDDCDETYLNGVLIGKTGDLPPDKIKPDTTKIRRAYAFPAEVLKYGQENTLAVRVFDAGGKGGMLGLPHVRINRQKEE